MDAFNVDFTPAMYVLVFCTAALIQFAKKIPTVANYSDFFPLLSCLVGVGLAFSQSVANPVVSGIIIGMVASGSYCLVKTGDSTSIAATDDAKAKPAADKPSMN